MKVFKGVLSVGTLIGYIVVAIVLGATLGIVADSTIGINQSESNVTGATYTLTALVPLFLVIMVVISYAQFSKR